MERVGLGEALEWSLSLLYITPFCLLGPKFSKPRDESLLDSFFLFCFNILEDTSSFSKKYNQTIVVQRGKTKCIYTDTIYHSFTFSF